MQIYNLYLGEASANTFGGANPLALTLAFFTAEGAWLVAGL